jgi:hypothetical protein
MGVTVVRTALTAETAVTRARASVVIVAPVAETSAALLAAASSVSIANAVVTAVVPVANLNYIFMASGAYLDTSGRFQYFPEEVFVTDATFRVVGKTLNDTFGSDDYIVSKSSDLAKHDEISVPDFIIRTLEYIRTFTDTTEPVEALSYTFARPLANTFGTTDAASFTAQKPLFSSFGSTDFTTTALTKANFHSVAVPDTVLKSSTKSLSTSFSQTDAVSRNTGKALANTFTTTDATSYAFTRPLASSFGSTDFATTHLTKSNVDSFSFADSLTKVVNSRLTDTFSHVDSTVMSADKALAHFVTTTDVHNTIIGRVINDGFAMNDAADLADGITYQTVKYVTNVTFVNDSSSRAWNANKADSISLGSAGFLSSQNYCDLSYFAEDYVGVSRTFS